MPFTAADVMRRASIILQDTDAVRWTAVEICDWLNEAQRTIVSIKPNALSRTVTLTLVNGTRQSLPPEYTMLSKVVCNVSLSGARGKVVKTLARREVIDSAIPGWHDPSRLPFSNIVGTVWQDYMAPREFYVIPGNNGAGRVEAIVGVLPTNIPIPGSDPLDFDSYTTVIEFDERYQGILLDLLLTRAFSKDMASPDSAQRAASHLTLATNALQALMQSESNAGLAYQYAPNPAG